MTKRAFLGIDCGTQSTKAILLDAERGAPLAIGRAPHELIHAADGTREQQPEWWIDALVAATRAALAEAGAVAVAGISVSGQQHGLVALDAGDRPVRPAKLWNDTTTAAECAALTERLGGPAAVLDATGNTFLPGYTAPKVLWLQRHDATAYAAARRFCLPHDYLNLWLTGSFVTEPGDASGTAYFDARSRAYSRPVLDALDPHRDWDSTLPAVRDSRSVIGGLRGDVAEKLGLDAGTPVSAGGGDNMCAAIGVGAVSEGPVVVSLGTSGTAFAYRSEPSVDPRGEAAAFCDSTGGWLPLVCTLNCTGPTDWIRDLLGLTPAAFEKTLRAAEPGARGLTFLPYMDGERTPSLPAAAGAFVGLDLSHGPGELVRAVAEGVVLSLAYAIWGLRRAGVQPREITLVGGGAASDGLAQLCADVLELPVVRPGIPEAAAAGAARQAQWVVDGVTPRVDDLESPRWQPRPSDGLRSAAARADQLRDMAIEGRL